MGESDPLDGLNSENRNEAERKGGISVFGFLNETESCGDWEGMTFSYPSQLSRKTTVSYSTGWESHGICVITGAV